MKWGLVRARFANPLTLLADTGPAHGTAQRQDVRTVGLMSCDFPGVAFDLRVAEGDSVRQGQILCVDRHRPDICFTAPASGRVRRIAVGARRRLETMEIAVDDDAAQEFDSDSAQKDDAALRHLLLGSGLWTGFRARPFGHIPDKDQTPAAIFVSAIDTRPGAADPTLILASQLPLFERGMEALLRLTAGSVYLCQPPGPPLIAARDRLRIAPFAGPHPAGSAGIHIHRLLPVSRHRTVWQIGYQDVTAIGHLLETGRIMASRILSLTGSALTGPALVMAPMGASLADLIADRTSARAPILLSGAILGGQERAFLGRHDVQVTALDRAAPALPSRRFWHRLLDRLPAAGPAATLPLESFERAFPFDLLPVPLMRALAVGDVETAERLGCLQLLEDDLAGLSWLCPSGSDYGALLRHALTALETPVPA